MKRGLKIALISIVCLLGVAVAGFFLYVSDYYRADETAIAVLSASTVRLENRLTILSPSTPSDTGFIFYPGGKVEHTAYLPLLDLLRQQGITCVLVEMPFHLAVFDPGAAGAVFDLLPDIQRWYIGGHSLGGAMAGSYAAQHQDQFQGLILLGAYRYGDYPAARSLTLYGSEDHVLDRSKITDTEYVVEIAGGNHAGFGSYGPQKGDGTAAITPQAQQVQTAAAILEFMEGGEAP